MITINGKEYRNLQEQVQKNMDDIEELQERVDAGSYTKEESDEKFQTIAGMTDYYDKTSSDAKFQTIAGMTDYYDKTSSDAKFQTISGMSSYATTSELSNKQDTLISGTNIKTINGNSILGSGNIVISGSGGSYTAGTGIDITNNAISVDADVVVTKDANNNVAGILQVEQIRSETLGEDDDCKADIYLSSGLRKSQIVLETSGEESGSSIVLKGTTALESEGEITLYGETTFVTDNRITVKDNDNTSTESVAYLSDIPTVTTYTAGSGISISNGSISADNTIARVSDIPTVTTYTAGNGINISNGSISVDSSVVALQSDLQHISGLALYAHNITLDITYSGSNRIVGKASFVSTSSTQITSFNAFKDAVQTRGVVVASGVYTGSSSANNGRITCFSYGQGSYSQLCATVVYDYTDILDVVSVSSSTITDTVTSI